MTHHHYQPDTWHYPKPRMHSPGECPTVRDEITRAVQAMARALSELVEVVRSERLGAPVALALDTADEPETAPLWDDGPIPTHSYPLTLGAGARIAAARMAAGCTQAEFVRKYQASGINWGSSTQSAIERAARPVNAGEVAALDMALGVTLTWSGGAWR